MNGQDGLILWVLGGAGTLFLYAAYTKQHPGTVLAKTLGTVDPAPKAAPLDPSAGIDVKLNKALPPSAGIDVKLKKPLLTGGYTSNPRLYIPGTINA